ncbi:MAG: hypothetical protein JNG86_06340, partial [Verrucomicrobiaceae bacterium]|nr:hypothetical protein [Verrucomicrobiaceae bacterium]
MSLCQTFPTIRLAACGLLLGTTLRMHAQQAASVPALEIAPGVTIPLGSPLAVEPEKMTNWQLLEIAAGHLRSDQDEEAKCRMLAVRSALRRKLAPKAAALVADTPAAFRAEAAAEAAWLLALTDKEDPQCGKWIQDARDHLGHAPEWHSDHARAWLAGVLQLLDKKEESAALLAAI